MANMSIYNAFDRMWQHIVTRLNNKANIDHNHDDVYCTEVEIDTRLSEVNTLIENITSGDVIIAEANHAVSSDTATSATTSDTAIKATQDENGKVIADTYETKIDSQTKLDEAKSYTDTKISGLTSTVSANTQSISSHTQSIASLQSELDSYEEIASSEITALFSA